MNAQMHKGFEVGAAGEEAAPPPKGRHLMEIIDSDSFTLRGETELKFQARIIGGRHKGSLLDFAMDVTRHFEVDDDGYEAETAKAERGDREYAALRWATGVFDPKYTDDLHNKPFAATISYRNGSYRVDGFDRPREYDAVNENAPTPKQAKPTPARGPDGRFLPRGHAEPEARVEQAEERKPWEDVAAWTPEQRFMFDLEGDLYQLTALSAMLETLLTPITHKMAGYDRPASAALDYAVTNLADAVREIEERYMAVRFPDKADAA